MSGTPVTPDLDDDAREYDPKRHDNQIVALYQTDARAHAGRDALLAVGVPSSAIQLVARSDYAAADTTATGQGFWGAIKSLFVPDEDVTAYGHAVHHHGHAMLVVTPDGAMDRRRVIQALESTDPIDFDAKLEEWRQSGYDYSTPAVGAGAVGAAAGMASAVQTAPLVDVPGTDAFSTPDTMSPAADRPEASTIVEERMRVGTRETPQGRVRSYVVERPAGDHVRLHEEHVVTVRHTEGDSTAPRT